MASVHRAVDVSTGRLVALKRLRKQGDPAHVSRFQREAQLLRRLDHPNIVQYVAHDPGHDPPWLAMELVEGRDLRARMRRGRLDVPTAIAIARDVAAALEAMHEAGLVHRDLKPENVVIVEDDAGPRAKLLDLGVARDVSDEATALTTEGTLLGTPYYMSPEQARGPMVDARTDLWSLGVVLFEMLGGAPPFSGSSAAAVLAKILVGDVPRLASVRPDVPASLDDLVAELLERDPAARPSSAMATRLRLASIASDHGGRAVETRARREKRLHFVLMVVPSSSDLAARAAETLRQDGAQVERASGRLLVALYGADRSSTDDALACARAALGVRELDAGARIALTLSRGEREDAPDPLEHAAALLQRGAPGQVALDEATASILGARASYAEGDGVTLLVGVTHEAATLDSSLVVGREAELGAIEGLCRAAWQEETARAALIVGEAGSGKSTLVAELLRRVNGSGAPLVVPCAGDARDGDVPYAFAARGLRGLAGLRDSRGEDDEERAFSDWARAALGPDASTQLPFLLAIVGARRASSPGGSGEAVAPERFRAEIRRAWMFALHALARTRPLLIVAEDTHWADHASIELLTRTLDAEAPIAIVASARSQGDDARQAFGAHPNATEIALAGLTPRACERLVRRLLPPESGALVPVIVARAGGNPLFLRELALAPRRSPSSELPASLELVVQQRLDALAPSVREVARVAAAFGDTAYVEGVRHVVDRDVRADVAALVQAGVLALREEPASVALAKVAFRHSFLRETAERMTAPEDARRYHERIYGWLQRLGAPINPQVLAHHAAMASRAAEATALYETAALDAARVYQLHDAVALRLRALRVAIAESLPPDEVVEIVAKLDAHLQLVRITDGAIAALDRAVSYVDRAGTPKQRARVRVAAASALAHVYTFPPAIALFDEAEALLGGDAEELVHLCLRRARQRELEGRLDLADACMRRATELQAGQLPSVDFLLRHAVVAASLDDVARAHEYVARARAVARTEMEVFSTLKVDTVVHYLDGDYRKAYEIGLDAVERARQLGLGYELASQLHNAGESGIELREPMARALLEESVRMAVVHGFELVEEHSRALLSYMAALDGDEVALGALVRAQGRMLGLTASWHAITNGLNVARAYRALGRRDEAVKMARSTIALAERGQFLPIRRHLAALLEELGTVS
jgi:tetratricopeptide (TPR) repeat protein